jgi:hypothetical protein
MNPTVALLALAALLLVNRVVMPRVAHQAPAFWGLFALNAALLGWVVAMGVPGTGGHGPARWVVAALLTYHLILYVQTRARGRAAATSFEEERALLRQLREAREAAPPSGHAEGGTAPVAPTDAGRAEEKV